MQIRFSVLVLLIAIGSGCTHTQLRTNTVRKAETLNDIYQQQVLDNLAKFICDPNSLPHFAVPTQGTSAVNDSIGADGGVSWNFTRFVGATLGSGGTRQMTENWVMEPVRDPRKLERMRCAYQMVVSRCGFCDLGACPDCHQVLNKFYTGETHNSEWTCKSDRVSPACLNACEPWFGAGKECDVPSNCNCTLVGHYCDQYVWVNPTCYDQLAKLTLCILDFAENDPPPLRKPTKEVTLYLTKDGLPSNSANASQVVVAEVAEDIGNVFELSVSNVHQVNTTQADGTKSTNPDAPLGILDLPGRSTQPMPGGKYYVPGQLVPDRAKEIFGRDKSRGILETSELLESVR